MKTTHYNQSINQIFFFFFSAITQIEFNMVQKQKTLYIHELLD